MSILSTFQCKGSTLLHYRAPFGRNVLCYVNNLVERLIGATNVCESIPHKS